MQEVGVHTSYGVVLRGARASGSARVYIGAGKPREGGIKRAQVHHCNPPRNPAGRLGVRVQFECTRRGTRNCLTLCNCFFLNEVVLPKTILNFIARK